MNRLLKFEFHKLFRQKSFIICGIILLAVTVINALAVRLGMELAELSDLLGYENTGLDSLVNGLSFSNILIFLSVFVPLFVCDDFTGGTMKNIVSRGYTVLESMAAKFIAVLTGGLIYVAAAWLISFVTGLICFGKVGTFSGETAVILIGQLLSVIAFIGLYFLISALLCKSGGAIAMCIILPSIISLIFSVTGAIVSVVRYADDTAQIAAGVMDTTTYWIDGIFSTFNSGITDNAGVLMILAAAYFCVFSALGFLACRKREV